MSLKHFVLVLAAACAPAALAADAGQVLATYSINAGQENGHFVAADVALTADGTLSIVKTHYTQPKTTEALSTTLAPAVLDRLKYRIRELSTAEISTTRSPVVCMMISLFPPQVLQVARGYDYQAETFGALAVVDNNAGCATFVHIAPKDADDVSTAKALEAQLEVLTLTAINAAQ